MKQKKPQVQLSTLKELVEDANMFLTGYYGLPERRKSPDYAIDQTKTGRSAFHRGHTTCLLLHETDRNDPSIIGEEVGHWIHWHENPELFAKKDEHYQQLWTAFDTQNFENYNTTLQNWLSITQLIEFIGALSRLAFCEHRTGSASLLRITLLRNQFRIAKDCKDILQRFPKGKVSPEEYVDFFHDKMRYSGGQSLAARAYGNPFYGFRETTPELRYQCLKAPTLDDVRALLKKPETTAQETATGQETPPQPSHPTE